MKKNLKTGLAISFAGLSTLLSFPTTSHATSYASKLANTGTSISFLLNEGASNVKIITATTTNNLGALPKGVNTANLTIAGVYKVQVISSNAPGYFQTSDDNNNFCKYVSPRGIAIATNPAYANFGRIYIANSAAGTVLSRTVGQGLYLLNADQSDALGRGDTASRGGVAYAVSASNPYRLALGRDDGNLYVNAFATADATTWAYDPDVTAATNVFAEIGENTNPSIHTDAAGTPIVTGSLAAGNLTLINHDGNFAGRFNKILSWSFGSSLPFNNANSPTVICSDQITSSFDVIMDSDIGLDGKFYVMANRSAGTDASSLRVYDANGTTTLWDSLSLLGSPDPLAGSHGITLSADYKLLTIMHDNNKITILKLTNGIPDWSSRVFINQTPSTGTGRDIAMDIAGNIYTVSSGQGLLRVWSAGGLWYATTASDGHFNIVSPATLVSVSAPDNLAAEVGPDTGTFTISRSGDLSNPVTVNYAMSGTASNGVDYTTLTGTATILGGSSSVDVTLSPIADGIPEFTETATMTLLTSTNYALDIQTNASITISDADPTQLVMGSTPSTMYERLPGDSLVFQVLRKGDITTDVTANILYSGTATNGQDYSIVTTTVHLPPGIVSTNFSVNNGSDNTNLTGNLTIIATLDVGTGYSIGTPSSATNTIIDDELATETVLFADPLTADTSANWNVTFGSNNGIDDEQVVFAISLSGDSLPAAPNGSDSALRVTVNKSEGSAGGAAGINLYPIGQSFSGDYALRFNMYLAQGTATTTASEYAIFGINHSSLATNWVLESAFNAANPTHLPFGGDGVWASVLADGSGSAPGDFSLITATNFVSVASASAASEAGLFKKPPFNAVGSPASIASNPQNTWVDVELKTVGGVITMSIDKTPILTYTNTSGFTSGDIMLGYMDSYDSIGQNAFVYYSNLRVVNLSSTVVVPHISTVSKAGSIITINFTGGTGDASTAFHVQSSATVTNFLDDATATISTLSAGSFRATLPVNGANRFYRIRR